MLVNQRNCSSVLGRDLKPDGFDRIERHHLIDDIQQPGVVELVMAASAACKERLSPPR